MYLLIMPLVFVLLASCETVMENDPHICQGRDVIAGDAIYDRLSLYCF